MGERFIICLIRKNELVKVGCHLKKNYVNIFLINSIQWHNGIKMLKTNYFFRALLVSNRSIENFMAYKKRIISDGHRYWDVSNKKPVSNLSYWCDNEFNSLSLLRYLSR